MNQAANASSEPAPAPGASPAAEQLGQDLHATLGARQELGPRYEAELVESFLRRLDASIDARIDQRLATPKAPGRSQPVAQSTAPGTSAEEYFRQKDRFNPGSTLIGSLAISIPLIAIAGGIAGLPGILGVLALVGFLNVYYDQQHR
jgi:hypothetical protein